MMIKHTGYRLNVVTNLLSTLLITLSVLACQPEKEVFTQRVEENIQLDTSLLGVSVVADSLIVPWELVWGPDDWIWATEERGTIMRINPRTGEQRVLLRLNIGERPEGLQAMIVHPDQKKYPYVIIHYKRFNKDSLRYNVVERYTYRDGALVDPKLIMENRAGRGHTGSRLAWDGPERILWATGDQALKETVQNLEEPYGKVLRMDLDGNIPDDNPLEKSYVYAWGFRNMQGMVVTPENRIYVSEHGDATEDEVNLVKPRGNYGFPDIEGVVDNDLEQVFAERNETIDPLLSWTPTIAPAGMDYYASSKIPEWKNALLLTMLKGQGLRVLKLNDAGDKIIGEEIFLEKYYGRIRDICVSPAGDVYIATSNHDWNPMTDPDTLDDRILRIARVENEVKTPLVAKVVNRENKVDLDGESLYQQYCFSCHKEKGRGLKGVYPALAGSSVVKDKEKFIKMVLSGKSGGDYAMPAFGFLIDQELQKILNYVRTSLNKQPDAVTVQEIVDQR